MSKGIAAVIADAYRRTHGHVLELVNDLPDELLVRRAGPSSPSVAFHLWHLARWADFLQEVLHGPGSQLWDKEKVAASWGLRHPSGAGLGYAETGMGMDDEAAANLSLPPKSVLFNYVRRAFGAAEEAVAAVDDQKLNSVYTGPRAADYFSGEKSLAYVILRSLRHENRHLGMIECLLGAQRPGPTNARS